MRLYRDPLPKHTKILGGDWLASWAGGTTQHIRRRRVLNWKLPGSVRWRVGLSCFPPQKKQRDFLDIPDFCRWSEGWKISSDTCAAKAQFVAEEMDWIVISTFQYGRSKSTHLENKNHLVCSPSCSQQDAVFFSCVVSLCHCHFAPFSKW